MALVNSATKTGYLPSGTPFSSKDIEDLRLFVTRQGSYRDFIQVPGPLIPASRGEDLAGRKQSRAVNIRGGVL